MKIFLSILYLISGPVCCSDVFGYSGGSVLLFPDLKWDVNNTRYMCKMEQSGCVNIIKAQTKRKFVNSRRFMIYSNAAGNFTVLIRELNPQDSAVYRFGVGNEKHKDVELTVQNDSCCGGIKRMKAYLGETATFKCNYPEKFTKNYKYMDKFGVLSVKDITSTRKGFRKEQKGRFSIFDNRRSKVFSVTISDVREDDGGVYSCGVWKKSGHYYSYFHDIHLQVTGSSVIITVCVCVALLLIGGSALIVHKVRNHMIQDSASTGQRTEKYKEGVYITMGPVQKSLHPKSNIPDLVYEDPDRNTNQKDFIYETMVHNSNQSDSIYDNNEDAPHLQPAPDIRMKILQFRMKILQFRMKIFQFRMKIFLSTLYLISGPVCCSDVFGYSGGSILLFSDLQWDVNKTRYICRVEQSGCLDIMKDQTKVRSVTSGRFMMYSNVNGEFTVLIRELNPQDSAVYRFGVGNEKHKDIKLTVQSDSCCGGITKTNAYLGETATFDCNHPDEVKMNSKYLINLNDQNTIRRIICTGQASQKKQKDRFSISDDRSSNVFSVNISDVTEDDVGVYLCGVWKNQKSVGYYSYFREVQLKVSAPGSSIITVCVCGILLLTGVAALIFYRWRNHMIQDSASTDQRTDRNNEDDDYENVSHGNRYNNISMGPVHQSPNPNIADLVYENPDPNTHQSDSDYENTNQSDFIYENVTIKSSG
ncbi:hypothetical protein SRHO_G00178190 [Serrasalmus rhombeus]